MGILGRFDTDPVELRPGHGHVPAVRLRVAGEGLGGQEHQVLIRQAALALHLRLVLHIKGLAELGPQHLVWHQEGDPALFAKLNGKWMHLYCAFLTSGHSKRFTILA